MTTRNTRVGGCKVADETNELLTGHEVPQWVIDMPELENMVRDLGDRQWLVLRWQLFNLQVAICTPPPNGGYLEMWDYEPTPPGTVCAAAAFLHWPNRDATTELWIKHRWVTDGGGERTHLPKHMRPSHRVHPID
ncbi:MAG: hypothetical protein GY930_11545 [bacterium]|nr:hypothetical protein [bacterium]